jgi:hypothetical protein
MPDTVLRLTYCETCCENSDVLLATESVAVVVIVCPTAIAVVGVKVKEALSLASVVTAVWSMNFLPSLPEGLEKS